MTRRKRLAIIIALVLVCVVLSLFSCSSEPIAEDSNSEATAETTSNTVQGLVLLCDYGSQAIMYDPETRVIYVVVYGGGTGISPMYNADGTLKL